MGFGEWRRFKVGIARSNLGRSEKGFDVQINTIDELRRLIPEPHPLVAAKIVDHIDAQASAFISLSPLVVLSTSGAGGVELSPKGDDPGFVKVADDRTLIIPERPGNRMALGLLNILENPAVGLAFFLPGTEEVLRVIGRAALWNDVHLNEDLAARNRPALLTIKVAVEKAYFHCARPIKRSRLWDPTSWTEPMAISFREVLKANVPEDVIEARLAEQARTENYREL